MSPFLPVVRFRDTSGAASPAAVKAPKRTVLKAWIATTLSQGEPELGCQPSRRDRARARHSTLAWSSSGEYDFPDIASTNGAGDGEPGEPAVGSPGRKNSPRGTESGIWLSISGTQEGGEKIIFS